MQPAFIQPYQSSALFMSMSYTKKARSDAFLEKV